MATCEILDLRCVLVNQIIGDVGLAVILLGLVFMIASGKLRFGQEVTFFFGAVGILLGGMAFGVFQPIFAFLTALVAILVNWIFQRLVKNRAG